MISELFFMGESQKIKQCSKSNSFDNFIISLKITIPNLRGISVPTNRNDYKLFSVTQRFLEIYLIVYNMTKNPKIYEKNFLATVLAY